MGDRSVGIGVGKILPFPKTKEEKDMYLALESAFRNTDDALNSLLRPSLATKTANYTATDTDYTILGNATGGAITITLPKAATVNGKVYVIKKVDASGNAVTIDGDGAETIDGSATQALSSQYDKAVIQSDGSNWHIIGE